MALTYKVGDKVKIKNLDWYNANKQPNGFIMIKVDGKVSSFTPGMVKYCGAVFTIDKVMTTSAIYPEHYRFVEDKNTYCWVDEMIERLAVGDEIVENGTQDEVKIEGTKPAEVKAEVKIEGTKTFVKTEVEPEVKTEVKLFRPEDKAEVKSEVKIEGTKPAAKVEVVERKEEVEIKQKESKTQKPQTKSTKKFSEGEPVTDTEVSYDCCSIELKCSKSNPSFADALQLASRFQYPAYFNLAERVEVSIEYMRDGNLCKLQFGNA